MKIDIIIPVYKPDKSLFTLIESLQKQTIKIQNIILMNTEEKYFEQLVYGVRYLETHKIIKVFHLSKREFDHGKTRHIGTRKCDGNIFVMMTQDAMPADEKLLENLVKNLKDNVAVAYARQLPAPDCSELEAYMRKFNYPSKSRIKTKKDLQELGIKTFFCSNVCAAYRRDVYEKLGGFTKHTIFNEDMIYAGNAIKAGYGVAYEADAKVIHSHNYTNMQQLHRNFDLGVSQADHPEIFAKIPSESEGKKMIADTAAYFRKKKQLKKVLHLYFQSGFKYIGYLLGKNYKRIPRKLIYKLTMNREYWYKK